MKRIALLAFIVLFSNVASAQWLAVEGRITDATGIVPLESSQIDFELEVYDQGGSCLLYTESHSVNMDASLGYFNLNLGGGTPTSLGPFANIMSNALGDQHGCTITATSTRTLKIKYTDVANGGSQEVLSQNIEIGFSQYAHQAADSNKLQGMGAAQFIQDNGTGLTQANLVSIFDNGANQASLVSLVSGGSSLYISNSAGAVGPTELADTAVSPGAYGSATMVPQITVDADGRITGVTDVAVSAGAITGGDLESVWSTDGLLRRNGTGTYDVITDNSANWDSAFTKVSNLTAGEITQLENIDSSLITAAQWGYLANMGAQPLESGGALSASSLTTSGTVNADSLAVTNTSTFSGTATFSGGITSSGSISTAGFTSTAASAMTSSLSMSSENPIRFVDSVGSQYAEIKAPNDITSASYTLTLPTVAPGSTQILESDASGNLSWIATPSGGGGEPNTASNVTGSTGVGLWKQKTGADLEFKSLLSGSSKLSVSGGVSDVTLDVVDANIDHDGLTNFVANEHVDHSTVNMNTAADSGLAGGGDISISRNLSVDINGTTALGTAVDNADTLLIYDDSGTVLRKATRAELVLSEADVDAFVSNNGYAADAAKVNLAGDTMTGTLLMNSQTPVHFGDSSAGFVGLRGPSIGDNTVYELPANDGISGNVLQTDGAGQLSWTTASGADDLGSHLATTHLNLSGYDLRNLNLGLEATPGLSFSGDSNTGIWSPGGDAIAFSTAGNEAMAINATGKIGIGTTAPAAHFEIYGPNQNSTSSPLFKIRDTNSGGTHFAIDHGNLGGQYRIMAFSSDLQIQSGPNTTMQLKTNGNVGIGTLTPSGKLDIEGGDVFLGTGTLTNVSANEDLKVTGNIEFDGAIYGDGSQLTGVMASTVSGSSINTAALMDGSVTSAKIADGSIAETDLGPNSVSLAKLSDSTCVNGDVFKKSAGTWICETPAPIAVGADHEIPFNNAGTVSSTADLTWNDSFRRLTVNSNANEPLHVSSSNAPVIRIFGGGLVGHVGSAASSGISGGTAADMALHTQAGTNIVFGEGANEHMRIGSSGNVGIGVIAPNAKLDVRREVATAGTSPSSIKAQLTNTATSGTSGAKSAAEYIFQHNGTDGAQILTASKSTFSSSSGSTPGSQAVAAWNRISISGTNTHDNIVATRQEINLGTTTSSEVQGTLTAISLGSGSITNAYGHKIYFNNTGSTTTNTYGVYVGSMHGTNKYAFKSIDADAEVDVAGVVKAADFIRNGCAGSFELVGSGKPGAFCIQKIGGATGDFANVAHQKCYDADNSGARLCSFAQVRTAVYAGATQATTGANAIIGDLVGTGSDSYMQVNTSGAPAGGLIGVSDNAINNKSYLCCY